MIVRFEGGRELAAALAAMPAKVSRRILIESLKDAAEPMRDRMERNVAVGDPPKHLRDEMTINVSRGRDAREAAVAVGASKAGYYGGLLEFGTAHTAPQPWAGPAFDATWSAALQVLGSSLWRELAARGVQRRATVDTVVEGEQI